MPNPSLSLFTFTSFIIAPVERRPTQAATGASRRLRRLLAAASANEVPDPSEHALALDLNAHLRQLAQAE